jgi:prolyl oligopeptidase
MMNRPYTPPPIAAAEPVTEILHGVAVTDPYRWLEEQNSSRTREWICEQNRYAQAYLDSIPGREQVGKRIASLLAVEAQDSAQEASGRYFFRKRLSHQEQHCIYVRELPAGTDQLLVDPYADTQSTHTAVKLLRVSRDGNMLLYETKEGGERTGTFAVVDVRTGRTLPDILPRGYLRGFAFAPDGKSFIYVHEPADPCRPLRLNAKRHVFGTSFCEDQEIFSVGQDFRGRIALVADSSRIGFLVYAFEQERHTSFYLKLFESSAAPQCVFADASFSFVPFLVNDRVFALTNRDAPNFRVVELSAKPKNGFEWIDIIPETAHGFTSAWFSINASFFPTSEALARVFFCSTSKGSKSVRSRLRIGKRSA